MPLPRPKYRTRSVCRREENAEHSAELAHAQAQLTTAHGDMNAETQVMTASSDTNAEAHLTMAQSDVNAESNSTTAHGDMDGDLPFTTTPDQVDPNVDTHSTLACGDMVAGPSNTSADAETAVSCDKSGADGSEGVICSRTLSTSSDDGTPASMASADNNQAQKTDSRQSECAICLQSWMHPTQLPCGHIFCFLCAKGLSAAQSQPRCAMCRSDVPLDYFDHPVILGPLVPPELKNSDTYQWFYKGRDGFWQYDERACADLENAYQNGDRSCEIMVAGLLYIVDFNNMLQVRKNDPSKCRIIKRDLASVPKKGIAGVRLATSTGATSSAYLSGGEVFDTGLPTSSGGTNSSLTVVNYPRPKSASPIPCPPTNTPQTPHTPSAESGASSPNLPDSRSLHRAIEEIEHLSISDSNNSSINDLENLRSNQPRSYVYRQLYQNN